MSKSSNPTMPATKAIRAGSIWPPIRSQAAIEDVLSRAQYGTGMAACFLGAFWVMVYPFA